MPAAEQGAKAPIGSPALLESQEGMDAVENGPHFRFGQRPGSPQDARRLEAGDLCRPHDGRGSQSRVGEIAYGMNESPTAVACAGDHDQPDHAFRAQFFVRHDERGWTFFCKSVGIGKWHDDDIARTA
jgi:hypothetical protein